MLSFISKVALPVLIKFLAEEAVKQFLVDILKSLVKSSENEVDDKAVEMVEKLMFPKKNGLDKFEEELKNSK